MWNRPRGGITGISNQARNVYLNKRKVLEIEAPSPNACKTLSVFRAIISCLSRATVPRTMMKATRYGRGSTRLKRSSVGSTSGSRPLLIMKECAQ